LKSNYQKIAENSPPRKTAAEPAILTAGKLKAEIGKKGV
jgi:hypothetical protein